MRFQSQKISANEQMTEFLSYYGTNDRNVSSKKNRLWLVHRHQFLVHRHQFLKTHYVAKRKDTMRQQTTSRVSQ